MTAALLLVALVGAGPSWTLLDRNATAVVETRPGDGGVTWIRTTTTLPLPPAQVEAVLLDLPAYGGWIRGLTTWRVVAQEKEEAWAHGEHRLPWPLSPRDYVVHYTWSTSPAGGLTLSAASTTAKGPAPRQGVVRITSVHTTWTVTPTADGAARVSYTYASDPESALPRFMQESAWRTETLTLLDDLRREVVRRSQPR